MNLPIPLGDSCTVSLSMNCPNCGLSNADNAKFCANCGTPLGTTPQPPQPSYQPPPTYQSPGIVREKNPVMKNVGLGCLIVLLILLFVGFSCTRACFRGRRYYRHYGALIRPVGPAGGVYWPSRTRMNSHPESVCGSKDVEPCALLSFCFSPTLAP